MFPICWKTWRKLKMIVEKVDGNLLDMFDRGDFNHIAHGCNCFNVMGGGIAVQIAERYPLVKEQDDKSPRGDPLKLGTNDFVTIAPNKTVINMYTQYDFWTGGRKVEYSAIRSCFQEIDELGLEVGIPMIGAGLAGGDWETIEYVINSFKKSKITLVVFDG